MAYMTAQELMWDASCKEVFVKRNYLELERFLPFMQEMAEKRPDLFGENPVVGRKIKTKYVTDASPIKVAFDGSIQVPIYGDGLFNRKVQTGSIVFKTRDTSADGWDGFNANWKIEIRTNAEVVASTGDKRKEFGEKGIIKELDPEKIKQDLADQLKITLSEKPWQKSELERKVEKYKAKQIKRVVENIYPAIKESLPDLAVAVKTDSLWGKDICMGGNISDEFEVDETRGSFIKLSSQINLPIVSDTREPEISGWVEITQIDGPDKWGRPIGKYKVLIRSRYDVLRENPLAEFEIGAHEPKQDIKQKVQKQFAGYQCKK